MQRLVVARVLLTRPSVVFLDESTSSLDEEWEARLYCLLAGRGSTLVSVGHRATLKRFHTTQWLLQSSGLTVSLTELDPGPSMKSIT